MQPFVFISCCTGCEVGASPGWQPPDRLRAIACIGHGLDSCTAACLLRLSVIRGVKKGNSSRGSPSLLGSRPVRQLP